MSAEDTYEIPLQDQRVFGAGIKRKRVPFVPSSSSPSTAAASNTSSKAVGDLYLKLVLPGDLKGKEDGSVTSRALPEALKDASEIEETVEVPVCEVCKLPFSDAPPVGGEEAETSDTSSKTRPHEASLAHQVCLTHSHPPSHLDRSRKGLTYLASYGWDPDARRGLGASGQGIQFPIKTKAKDDKLGIGVVLPKRSEIKKMEKLEKLDAGKVKKLHEKNRKQDERLREMFYRSEDLDRYLGTG